MKKVGRGALIFWLVGSVLGLAATFGFGWKPLLGLDLQGGLSATLTPKPGTNPSNQAVEEAKNIIRQRVDGLGIAEPEVVRSGKTVVVQLPGLKTKADQDRAKEIIGTTAQLEFRSVLQMVADPALNPTTEPTSTVAGATTVPGATTLPEGASATTVAPATSAPATTLTPSGDEQGLAPSAPASALAPIAYQAPSAPDTTEPSATTPDATTPDTTAPAASAPDASAPATTAPDTTIDLGALTGDDTTPTVPEGGGIFSGEGGTYVMGPVQFDGTVLSDAQAQLGPTGTWEVNVKIKDGDKSRVNDVFNACFAGSEICPAVRMNDAGIPRGVIGMVLDGQVISAPTVDAIDLPKNPQGFVISGSFDHKAADALALQLRYGALPVEFEPATLQTVSATLGSSSLHAGLVSGIVGLLAVALYIIFFYRALGVVAVLSLLTSTAVLWTVISYLGTHNGLALTLAGITGIIVSVGVAVDSNVVFYEHLREDLSKGRSLRATVERSFEVAWRTILAADFVSLIGAAILYFLTVGSVRGFAFYLGLSTLIDLAASWFLMRPMVFWMARSSFFANRPGVLGIKPHRRASTGAPEGTEAVVA